VQDRIQPKLLARLDATSRTIWVYDDIAADGVKDASEAIAQLDASSPLLVRINSYGGDAFAGLSLYTALRSHPAKVHVQIDGAAASAAAIVAMAGDRIIMSPHGLLFFHRAWTWTRGNAKVLRDTARILDHIDSQIEGILRERSGAAEDQVRRWLDGEVDGTEFSAEQAMEAHLIDEIMPLKRREQEEPTKDQLPSLRDYVPDDPPGGDGVGVEGEWEKPALKDFTEESWENLSIEERRRIAKYFGFVRSLDVFGDLKLPHHFPPNHTKRNKASLAGVRNALALLSQTEGLSEADQERVRAHLRAHLPPEDQIGELVFQGLSRFVKEVMDDRTSTVSG